MGPTEKCVDRDALRPVLLWQYPSGNACRIFSAVVAYRHTAQALAGVSVEAIVGLDARQDSSGGSPEEQWNDLTPGPEAVNDIGREVRRYGGWLMQTDSLPLSLTRHALVGAVDFVRDTVTWPATAYALLSADVTQLATLLRASLAVGVDHKRLARGLHDGLYVDWRPLLNMPDGADFVANVRKLTGESEEGLRTPMTTASLAARALRLNAKQAARPENVLALRRACLSLLAWRIGLPGLAFVSPQDLTGALSPRGLQPASARPCRHCGT
ncbi:MAG: hypothetical protein LBS77_05795 [Desulfovibrio sp.]|jgi:hypothetical protein|nr:hypothetical protein [Desulfovibrio sp.]